MNAQAEFRTHLRSAVEDLGSSAVEYSVMIGIVLSGAIGGGLAYKRWMMSLAEGEVDARLLPSVGSAMSGFGAGVNSRALFWVGGLGVAGAVIMLISKIAGRRSVERKSVKLATALGACVLIAALTVLARFGLDKFAGATVGLPSMGSIVATLFALVSLGLGISIAMACTASGAVEGALLGAASGLVVGGVGQFGQLVSGVVPDATSTVTMIVSVLLACSGGLVGSAFVRRTDAEMMEGSLR